MGWVAILRCAALLLPRGDTLGKSHRPINQLHSAPTSPAIRPMARSTSSTDPLPYSALLKGVVISTLLGVGAELQFHGGSNLVEAVRQSTQQSVSRAGDQLTSKALDIQPTITIRPGAPVRLVVHHDLVFAPAGEH